MIVANTRAIVPGAVMSCRVVGVLIMEDEAGGDEKLLAVPSAKLTQRYAKVHNYTDLPSITLQQIEHFFAHYKDLEPNKWVKIVRWGDAAEARELVHRGHRAGEEGEDRGEGRELSDARDCARSRQRRMRVRTGRRGLRPVKRSFIDARIDRMLELCGRHGVALPPFALWREADFRANPDAARLIAERGARLERGRIQAWPVRARGPDLVHAADGRLSRARRRTGRLYAEKAMAAEDGQRAPHHYHVVKTEDIVNRGGARFVVELFKVDAQGAPLKERFRALKDVNVLDLNPGDQVRLEPGESLTLEPFIAHAFWAEGGAAVAGEVSLANDDTTDNYFLPPLRAFRQSRRTRRRAT